MGKDLEGQVARYIKYILANLESGEYDTKTIACTCGKTEHDKLAVYCVHCGEKLKESAHDDSL